MSRGLNQKERMTLDSLTGRVEALQGRLAKKRDDDKARRVYECVADAKRRLLDALREAES